LLSERNDSFQRGALHARHGTSAFRAKLLTRMARKKNSLVGNINRRKRKGISRPKSRSTVSKKAYRDMRQGWRGTKRRKKSAIKRKKSA
jgi:hypothetical protein